MIGFAQNTRDEVRIQGDGTVCGTLSANPGMKQTTYVCETVHTRSNGLGAYETDVMSTPATNNSAAVEAEPVACMSDTQTNASVAENVCGAVTSHAAKDAPVICMTNNTSRAAVDVECAGTLLAGGGTPPIIVSGSKAGA